MRGWLFALTLVVSCGGKLDEDASGSSKGPFMGQGPLGQTPSSGAGSKGAGAKGDPPDSADTPPVPGAGAIVKQVAVGGSHSCALLEDATVSCWGSNLYHEIGNTSAREGNALPLPVTGLAHVTALAAGGFHTCALSDDGTVSCWGWNQAGQLGDGTTTDSELPVRVVGLSDVVEITAGALHSCARLRDGTMRCWGLNHQGELGDGNAMVEAQPNPVTVSGLGNVASIAAGDLLTCATLTDGSARCWGDDCEGEVGDGTGGDTCFRAVPSPVASLNAIVSIAAGEENACAATADGRAFCWGSGPSSNGGGSTPELVGGLSGVTSIVAGASSCALERDGSVWCWSAAGTPAPARVSGLANVKQISLGGLNICALESDGHVFCWGINDRGQVGDGTTAERQAPSPVSL